VLLIWAGSGALVAVVAAAAGVGAVLLCSLLGLGAGKALGIGGLVAGGLAYAMGKHDKRLHPCSVFFIPMRAYAGLTAAAGGLIFFLPTGPAAPEDPRLDAIVQALSRESASGSSGPAREFAARYAALKDPALGVDEKRCHLALDAADPATARNAELYVRASNLKSYGDDGKRALCEAYLKRLRADFPKAACHVAVRGPFLWGVQGSSASPGAAPSIRVTSDPPRF
jgi:hypothetical protein